MANLDIIRSYAGAIGWTLRLVAEERGSPFGDSGDCFACSNWYFIYDGCIADGADVDQFNTIEIAFDTWIADNNFDDSCITGNPIQIGTGVYTPFALINTTNEQLVETMELHFVSEDACDEEGVDGVLEYHFIGEPTLCPCEEE